MFYLIAGHPHVVVHVFHIDLIGQPVVVGIDHGIISGRLHPFAEGVDDLRDLCRRKRTKCGAVFRVKRDWK